MFHISKYRLRCSSTLEAQDEGTGSNAGEDYVTRAEILWCLKIVRFHDSQNSGGEVVRLFRLMFPDLEIANKIKLQRTKIAYTINFSLEPYFLAIFKICAITASIPTFSCWFRGIPEQNSTKRTNGHFCELLVIKNE